MTPVAMSADPKVPPAPRLRAIREALIWSIDARHNVPRAGAVSALYVIDGLPPAPTAANAHRLLQASLVPVAGKYVARRPPDAGRMVEFVGGLHAPGASPGEHLAMLRRLLVQQRDEAPQEMLAAGLRFDDLTVMLAITVKWRLGCGRKCCWRCWPRSHRRGISCVLV
jgi:hypothetical protein